MATSIPQSTNLHAEATIAPLRSLIAEYGATFGGHVWFWQRVAGEWELVAGTCDAARAGPGSGAQDVPNPDGPQTCVEVVAATPEESRRGTSLLRVLLTEMLRHQREARFFGREIAERYEEITLLYTISEILGSVISMEEAARRILGEVMDTMSVKRAALWIHDPEIDGLRLIAAVGGEGRGEPIQLGDETSITAAVFRDRRPMILEPDDVFPRTARDFDPANRESFLSVPVNYTPPRGSPRTIGVINLIGRTPGGAFSAGDHKLITAIASQIGAAIENNRLVAESLRRERVDRELELAHDLQMKLLPTTDQFRDRAEVAARCTPADSVGGDFYHLFRLSGGRFGVVIGDVSSHGFGAALIMALTMSAIAISASEGDPPAEVLRQVHRALIDELESTEMYLTLFYGVIDPQARRLTYANAGHPHAFLIPAAGEPVRLGVTNPPFGLVDLPEYAERAVEWSPREDILFLFTDGLSDTMGQGEGERFIVDLIADNRDRPLEDLLESLFSIAPAKKDIPSDDRTAVLVRA
jgi:sigma-B regulation protein RsbU (phosphoserine phosphatase)